MKINSINSNYNNTNFGAKIDFKNPVFRYTMTNHPNKGYAKNILNRIEKVNLGDVLMVEMRHDPGTYPSLRITNQTTKAAVQRELLECDAKKADSFYDKNYNGGCRTLYKLLESVLDTSCTDYRSFWGAEVEPALSQHYVFDVIK